MRRLKLIIPVLLFCWGSLFSQANPAFFSSLVHIESYDKDGRLVHLGTGTLLKNNYVATNYHYVSGAHQVKVYKHGSSDAVISEGYIGVNEELDLIVLYVRGLKGTPVSVHFDPPTASTGPLTALEKPTNRQPVLRTFSYSRDYNQLDALLYELVSKDAEEPRSGPVFAGDKLIGFLTAGYYEQRKYFGYMVPVEHVRSLLNISLIIKSYTSLGTGKPIEKSHFQEELMASLTNVLWMDFEDAVERAGRKNKKILIDVYTDWNGWCKLMYENTYSNREMIRYINENFIAVRLNGEGNDTIRFKGQTFTYKNELRSHELAYSLLEGNMSYPSTVFLDEEINLLTVVPGYVEMGRMAVILRYFKEDIYKDRNKSYEDYERSYLSDSR